MKSSPFIGSLSLIILKNLLSSSSILPLSSSKGFSVWGLVVLAALILANMVLPLADSETNTSPVLR